MKDNFDEQYIKGIVRQKNKRQFFISVMLIIIVALLILMSCAKKPYYGQNGRRFLVTEIKEPSMKLDGRYWVPKCDTCKVGDYIFAFRIGK